MDRLAIRSSKILGKKKSLRVERKTRKMLYFVDGVSIDERQMSW